VKSICTALAVLITTPIVSSAQLLPEQRLADFQSIVSLYDKRYAPFAWKNQAFGVDVFNVQPWVDRIKAAKNDLEFLEIEAQYVAQLQDTHSAFSMGSNFTATLGMTVDIYDGKVLIDGINRVTLPAATYPFALGDELVSLDGKTAEEWIALISKYRQWGNPVSTRRMAADQITARSQVTFPRAHEIGDTASVDVRRANGDLEHYTIPWIKNGTPVINLSQPRSVALSEASAQPDYGRILEGLRTWKLSSQDLALAQIPGAVDEAGVARTYVNGIGVRNPIFAAALPQNFVLRLGRQPTDFHFSGTFQAGGNTIGYLRIPNFSPPNIGQAITEIAAEIAYFQQNTQGLVVDVMRNPGGGCYMLDVAARLTPFPFYFFGEQLIVTRDRLNAFENLLAAVKAARIDQWIIDTYQLYVDAMRAAYNSSGSLTGPIAACAQTGTGWAPIMFGNPPAPVVYTKPFIVLIDEFSISAADIFPSMIQDNARAPLVGMRTSGGGGSVSAWPAGFYSDSTVTNTNSLVVRKNPIVTQDLPTAPYVENIGARPDIPLNYMTRDNLVNAGRPFVAQFTDIIVEQIRKAAP
jgi:hypothetical protein